MINLNILPPQEKEKLVWLRLSRWTNFLAVWLSLFLVVFALLLASIFLHLTILSGAQEKLIESRQKDAESQRLAEMEIKINKVNQRIKIVSQKQEQQILWTSLFEELSRLVGPSLYLTSFSYQPGTDQVSITGWADKREQLLALQGALETSSFFSEVNAPLANLIKQEGISFSFTFKPAK